MSVAALFRKNNSVALVKGAVCHGNIALLCAQNSLCFSLLRVNSNVMWAITIVLAVRRVVKAKLNSVGYYQH